ncbi:MAG: hypothetical protein WD036_02655 [Bauldia sp.]
MVVLRRCLFPGIHDLIVERVLFEVRAGEPAAIDRRSVEGVLDPHRAERRLSFGQAGGA